MRNDGLFLMIFFILLALAFFTFSKIHILLTLDVKNKDIKVNLNIKYLFRLIDINIPIYPINKKNKISKKNKIKEKHKSKIRLNLEEIKIIYILLDKVKIEEVYANINFGNENISFTSYLYVIINFIYSNLMNIINCNYIYLKVTPEFTKNYLDLNARIKIQPTIKDIIAIYIAVYKIYKRINKDKKDGVNIEVNKCDKKSYGNNI